MSSTFVFLSHALSDRSPGFGGSSGFVRESVKRIARGDSSNSDQWTLSNHIGTHVDFPRHFSDLGETVDRCSAAELVFSRVEILDMPAEPGQLLAVKDFAGRVDVATELLLVRTGFEQHRSAEIYWENNPGFLPEVAEEWRRTRPQLRAVGFDFLSLTAFRHRELGREAHRAFLSPDRPGRPILIIEDMALSGLCETPSEVIVAPLRVQGADGAPVTVIARTG